MALPITITYNGFTIGASNSTIREGSYRESHSYNGYSIDVDFILTGSDDASFVTNLKAAETALKLENKKLTVDFGSTNHISLDPNIYTGLNIKTKLSKSGDQLNTNRSRLYSLSISVELPAYEAGKEFQKNFGYSISWDTSNRMTISISGTYTAGNSLPAGSNYLNDIETWVGNVFSNLNTIFTAITITKTDFELISEKVDFRDELNHIVGYTRTYKQRLFPDQASASDHASIKNAQVSFTRSYTNRIGHTGKGPQRVAVSYSCSVDNRATTYAGIKALYTSIIKPWIVSQAKASFAGTMATIEQGSEKFDVAGNTISSNLTVLIYGGSNGRLREDISMSVKYNSRKNYIDRWDGQPYSYNVYSVGEEITASVSVNIDQIGDPEKITYPGVLPPTPRVGIHGTWDEYDFSVNFLSTRVGKDPDGVGGTITIGSKSYSQQLRWIAGARIVQPFRVVRHRTVLRGSSGQRIQGGKNI